VFAVKEDAIAALARRRGSPASRSRARRRHGFILTLGHAQARAEDRARHIGEFDRLAKLGVDAPIAGFGLSRRDPAREA
jgi:hypothetical protein